MKKIISLMLATLLLGTMLSGCHGTVGAKAFAIPAEFDTSREHEITFWAKNDTNNDQVAVYKQAVADFEALYPNITVKIKWYTDYSRMYQDVITNIYTDTTPNVCITYPDHIATYLTNVNCVVPLNALMADAQYGLGGSALRFEGVTAEQIIPQFLAEGIIDGQQYALPFMRSTEVCYVNKTYVEALGFTLPEVLTWDFIWEVAEAAMRQDEDGNFLVNGQQTMIPVLYKSTDNMMIQYLRQCGARYSTADGQIEIFNDVTAQLLYTVAEQAERGTFSTFKIESYPANYLNRGQCIFAIDSTAGATWMGCEAPLMDIAPEDLVSFETVVMNVPQANTEQMQMISQGPSICVFNKSDPQQVLASWLFAQYLLTDDPQISYAQTEGYVPVTTTARENAAYQDYLSRAGEDDPLYYSVKLDATALLLNHTEHTFVTAVFNGSASLRNAAGQMIEEVTKAVRRGKTVDSAYLEQLRQNMITQYYLDETAAAGGGQKALGALPGGSVALLVGLAAVWLALGSIALIKKRKDGKNR